MRKQKFSCVWYVDSVADCVSRDWAIRRKKIELNAVELCVKRHVTQHSLLISKNSKKISLKFHSHTIWCFLPACLFYDVSDGTFSTDTENKKPTASYCVRFCPPQKLSHR